MINLVVFQRPRSNAAGFIFIRNICTRSFYFVSLHYQTKTIIMHEVSEIKLEALHGCEYHSLTYEGVVGINRQNVYRNGEIIDQLDTNEKVKIAWNEFLDDNGF